MLERQQAKLYHMRQKHLLAFGFEHHLVGIYSDAMIEKFRKVYYGGMSASILLLLPSMTSYKCWDCSVLVAIALEDSDYQVVAAHVDGIKYNPDVMAEVEECRKEGAPVDPRYDIHYFVEYKNDNKTWVVDTTAGAIYEKRIYYAIERPKIV